MGFKTYRHFRKKNRYEALIGRDEFLAWPLGLSKSEWAYLLGLTAAAPHIKIMVGYEMI